MTDLKIGGALLRTGECLAAMRGMKNDSIDLTVTSPPYDNLRTYNGFTFDFEKIALELYRITKPGGVVVWVVGDATVKGSETGTSFRQAPFFRDVCGFNLHDTMIYEKSKAHVFDPRQRRYKNTMEFMFILSKGKPKTFNPIMDLPVVGAGKRLKVRQRLKDGRIRSDRTITLGQWQARGSVWVYEGGVNHSTKDLAAFQHPAIFPEQLARDHIISWSNPGDLVLDPFMGSGTTGKISLQEDRQFIGIEISESYFKIASDRIRAAHVLSQTIQQCAMFVA